MYRQYDERTAYPQDKRDELIEFVLSGIAAFPGSELGYFVDALSRDRVDVPAPKPKPRATWSWRQIFGLGAVPRLT